VSKTRPATARTGESCADQIQHPHKVQERLSIIEERRKNLSVRENALAEREEAVMRKFHEYEVRRQEVLRKIQNDFEDMINRQQIDFEKTLDRLQKVYGPLNRQHMQKNEFMTEPSSESTRQRSRRTERNSMNSRQKPVDERQTPDGP
jgi:hypothetical protein